MSEAESQKLSVRLNNVLDTFKTHDSHAITKKEEFRKSRKIAIQYIGITSVILFFASIITLLFIPNGSNNIVSVIINMGVTILGIGLLIVNFLLTGNSPLPFLNESQKTTDSTTKWVEHRYITEKIRSQLYLYFMRVGDYANVANPDKVLSDNVAKIEEAIPDYVAEIPKIDKPIDRSKFPNTFDGYIEMRLEHQIKWYSKATQEDLDAFQLYKRRVIIISVATIAWGALVGGFFSWLYGMGGAALMASIGLSFQSWSKVDMIGKTYTIYSKTLRALNKHKENLDDNPDKNQFVVETETIFQQELDAWYATAIEAQSQVDNSILQSMQKYANEAPSTNS
ncbi:MAG: SLATT domain-containing protein [bacterium]|nr:SLATT domain-containing protein [bacterium]